MRLHYASIGKGLWFSSSTATRRSGISGKIRWRRWARTIWPLASTCGAYHLSSRPEGLEPYRMKHLVAHDWGANVAWVFAMLPSEPPQPAVQRPASGVDDSDVMVGEGDDRGCEVDHIQTMTTG